MSGFLIERQRKELPHTRTPRVHFFRCLSTSINRYFLIRMSQYAASEHANSCDDIVEVSENGVGTQSEILDSGDAESSQDALTSYDKNTGNLEHQANVESNADESAEGEHGDEEMDDDDFGSFDEASFEEFQVPETTDALDKLWTLSNNPDAIDDELEKVLNLVVPEAETTESKPEYPELVSDKSLLFSIISKSPRLKPPNWIKLKIRHSLLIKLGVPINLDELDAPSLLAKVQNNARDRSRSISVQDIDWSHFEIPEFSTLNVSNEKKQELMSSTQQTLSRIEEDILNNTSELFLQNSSDSSLDAKLKQMRDNYAQLIELSSVWQDQIRELQNSQEIYESVVQNLVGYSQKLQRNEILESLSKGKSKKGKRTF